MDIIKKFIDVYVPINQCNFDCPYCYISTWNESRRNLKDISISYSPDIIRKGLSKNRWQGSLMLNFCATGETLLCNELIPIVKELLAEGHYCMIVTNGTISPKFKMMAEFDDELKKRLFIKFSYHYLELKNKNLLDVFFDNVNMMKSSKISYTVELTPSDIYIPYKNELKEYCIRKTGALPHVTVCREENGSVPIMSSLDKNEYLNTWKEFDSELFDYKMTIFGVKRNEFCYAGAWSYTLDLGTGILKQCYRGKQLQNIFDDIDSPIKEEPIGTHCCDAHCWNGHAFLTFGDIPELEAPFFSEVRNRICNDGSEWLQPDMKNFMSHKLYESNKEYSSIKKKTVSFKYSFVRILKKIRKTLLK